MAKHVWSVLCSRAILDKYTNNVSLIDSLENVEFAPPRPFKEGQWSVIGGLEATLVSFVVRSDVSVPEEVKLRIQLVAPNGQPNEAFVTANVSLMNHARVRNYFSMRGIGFWSSGQHKFVVSMETSPDKWESVAEIPLDIKQSVPKTDN